MVHDIQTAMDPTLPDNPNRPEVYYYDPYFVEYRMSNNCSLSLFTGSCGARDLQHLCSTPPHPDAPIGKR
jgi:hypothetical protein